MPWRKCNRFISREKKLWLFNWEFVWLERPYERFCLYMRALIMGPRDLCISMLSWYIDNFFFVKDCKAHAFYSYTLDIEGVKNTKTRHLSVNNAKTGDSMEPKGILFSFLLSEKFQLLFIILRIFFFGFVNYFKNN